MGDKGDSADDKDEVGEADDENEEPEDWPKMPGMPELLTALEKPPPFSFLKLGENGAGGGSGTVGAAVVGASPKIELIVDLIGAGGSGGGGTVGTVAGPVAPKIDMIVGLTDDAGRGGGGEVEGNEGSNLIFFGDLGRRGISSSACGGRTRFRLGEGGANLTLGRPRSLVTGGLGARLLFVGAVFGGLTGDTEAFAGAFGLGGAGERLSGLWPSWRVRRFISAPGSSRIPPHLSAPKSGSGVSNKAICCGPAWPINSPASRGRNCRF